jgi:hypothetical protein
MGLDPVQYLIYINFARYKKRSPLRDVQYAKP